MTSTRAPARLGAAAVALALGLAACTTSGDDPTAGTTAAPGTSAVPATTSTTEVPATTTTTVAGTTTTTGAGARCAAGELSGSLGVPSPGAGQLYVPLVVRNGGARTCTLDGTPEVTLLDAGGGEIGSPATEEGGHAPTTVELAPGGTASTTLHTVNAGMSEDPCWAPSTEIRVVPPGDSGSLTLAGSLTVCGDTFSVGPFVAGEAGR